MPSARSASTLEESGPRAKPKSSMFTMLADVRPDLRTMSAATAPKRLKVPAEALRPKGKTQRHTGPPELEAKVLPVRGVDSDEVVGGGEISGDETIPPPQALDVHELLHQL